MIGRVEDVYGKYAEALRAGHQFAASGQLKEALRCHRAATELAGERVLPHVAMGGTLLRLNQPREALAAYERALELEPDQIDALSGGARRRCWRPAGAPKRRRSRSR